ncbi:hypothetical protein FRC12_013500 [Ceratobasidium sp. 428]|nr:hypothetical protein FRC12_013500 [Ceratobasidium sp. 428]
MIATEDVRILDDPVVMLEVWSHIRDGLLATLQRRFMAEHESIAVAVSGLLCASLVSFLHTAGKQTRVMVLASPWTQTLKLELERIMVQGGHLDDFGLGLRRQLAEPAAVLLRKVGEVDIMRSLCAELSRLKIAGDTECSLPEDPVRLVCVDVAEWLQIVPMFVA